MSCLCCVKGNRMSAVCLEDGYLRTVECCGVWHVQTGCNMRHGQRNSLSKAADIQMLQRTGQYQTRSSTGENRFQ